MAHSGLKRLGVPVLSRDEYLDDFEDGYQNGQHLTALGPSGRGKTRIVGQMLVRVANPDRQGVVLHGKIKGRDQTIERLSAEANMPITEIYPPSRYQRKIKHRDSHGWVLRPLARPGTTAEEENALLRDQYQRAIRACYHTSRAKPRILVVNETHQTHNDLRLRSDCEAPLMRGRPDCAVWSEIQRARHVSYMCYDQAEHMLIFYDPDVDNQRRYSEIGGGSDPEQLRYLADGLKDHTRTVADGSTISPCLYFRRSGNLLYIVDTT